MMWTHCSKIQKYKNTQIQKYKRYTNTKDTKITKIQKFKYASSVRGVQERNNKNTLLDNYFSRPQLQAHQNRISQPSGSHFGVQRGTTASNIGLSEILKAGSKWLNPSCPWKPEYFVGWLSKLLLNIERCLADTGLFVFIPSQHLRLTLGP